MLKAYIAILALCACTVPVYAQLTEQASIAYEGVGLAPRLGDQISLDLAFVNSTGEQVQLRDYFNQGRPVVLTFVYHTCPMLCSVLLDGVTRSLEDVPWAPGDAYEMITVSFSPEDTPERAAEQRARYLRRMIMKVPNGGF